MAEVSNDIVFYMAHLRNGHKSIYNKNKLISNYMSYKY